MKISITHNKKRILFVYLLIDCISARSAPQILSTRGEYTFLFLNFQIIGLYNSSDNSLLEIFSFIMPLPAVFYQKIYKPLKQDLFDIHHI